MIYQIVIITDKGLRIPEEGYSTRKSAEKKIKKTYSNKTTEIVVIPDIFEIGMKIYRPDGNLYGEIIAETGTFWHILRVGKEEDSRFLKMNFEEKFIKGCLVYKPEEEEVLDNEEDTQD